MYENIIVNILLKLSSINTQESVTKSNNDITCFITETILCLRTIPQGICIKKNNGNNREWRIFLRWIFPFQHKHFHSENWFFLSCFCSNSYLFSLILIFSSTTFQLFNRWQRNVTISLTHKRMIIRRKKNARCKLTEKLCSPIYGVVNSTLSRLYLYEGNKPRSSIYIFIFCYDIFRY